jgi:excisionase family DNA binding protein
LTGASFAVLNFTRIARARMLRPIDWSIEGTPQRSRPCSCALQLPLAGFSVSELEELFHGQVAVWVAGCLRRDMRQQLQWSAKMPPGFARDVLKALSDAAGVPADTAVAASGSAVGMVVTTSWITVHDAAAQSGLSERRVRQLAESGRIRSRRFGRAWQIDMDSLTNVLGRAA